MNSCFTATTYSHLRGLLTLNLTTYIHHGQPTLSQAESVLCKFARCLVPNLATQPHVLLPTTDTPFSRASDYCTAASELITNSYRKLFAQHNFRLYLVWLMILDKCSRAIGPSFSSSTMCLALTRTRWLPILRGWVWKARSWRGRDSGRGTDGLLSLPMISRPRWGHRRRSFPPYT